MSSFEVVFEDVLHQFSLLNLVKLEGSCSSGSRRSSAEESDFPVEQALQSGVNVSPGTVVFVLFLGPVNSDISIIFFQSLFQMFMWEGGDLFDSYDGNVLN